MPCCCLWCCACKNTCRHTVWKHCYAHKCTPTSSKHLQAHGLEALLYTHMCKPPAGARFGSIAIHAHAHPCAQNTCRRIVWKHCYTHGCPPISSKHLQAHGVEALLHTQVHTHMLKAPAGTRSGGIATHGRDQNACRQTCLKQCDTHEHAHRHIQDSCRLVVWTHCDTDR